MSNGFEGIYVSWDKATPQQKLEICRAVEDIITGKALPSPKPMPRVLRRSEVASLLNMTPKSVDRLARKGAFKRCYAPKTKKALGFTEASVRALIEQNCEMAV